MSHPESKATSEQLESFPLSPEEDLWLLEESIAATEEYERDPSTGRTGLQVQQALDAEYERLVKAG